MAAPPSYNEAVQASPYHSQSNEAKRNTTQDFPATAQLDRVPLPCVIPQTSKSFRGAFFSPFVRAYAPDLEAHGISKEDFVACIDGLNEVFVANPAFQTLGIAGGVMSTFYGIHPVQLAGIGLQVASGLASGATSYGRTKAYVKAVNANLFNPAGLQMHIMTTKKMMEKIGHPETRLQLPPLEEDEEAYESRALNCTVNEQDDPRMRRIKALEGYVEPLDFDVPQQVMPDNLLRKMGAAQAARMEKKQNKKMLKDRQEGDKKYSEKAREAEKKQREGDKEIAKLERKLAKERLKMEKKYGKKGEEAVSEFRKEETKINKDIAKERAKRDKEVAKEMKHAHKEKAKGNKSEDKTAQKIRWIVITQVSGDVDEDVASEEEEDSP